MEANVPSLQHSISLATFQISDSVLLDFSHLWCCLIEDYSRRGLAKGSDKLIALCGLVQEAQEQTGLRYCAGIWLDMIHTELCWVVREDESGSRAPTYRAPTWSWASIDGAVAPIASYSNLMTNEKHKIRSEIELVDSDTTVADDGQLTSAHVVLFGRLRPGLLTAIGGSRAETAFKIAKSVGNGGEVLLDRPVRLPKGPKIMDSILRKEDVGKEKHQSMPYQMLHVSTRQWSDDKPAHKTRTYYEVLALEEIEGRVDEFVRVGAGVISIDSWFDNHPMRRIKIF